MSELREYFVVLIAAAFVSTLGAALCHEKFKSAQQTLLGILLLFCILSPLPELIGDVRLKLEGVAAPDIPNVEDGAYYEAAELALCRGITLALADKFDLSEKSISVTLLSFNLESMSAERIHIILGEGARVVDHRALREYTEENFGGRCSVEIKFG